jgi:hypothetical protein
MPPSLPRASLIAGVCHPIGCGRELRVAPAVTGAGASLRARRRALGAPRASCPPRRDRFALFPKLRETLGVARLLWARPSGVAFLGSN